MAEQKSEPKPWPTKAPPNVQAKVPPKAIAKPIVPEVERPSFVSALISLFQKRGGGIPYYEYTIIKQGQPQIVGATVKLSDGSSYFGSQCFSKEEAAESAAQFAYNAIMTRNYRHSGHSSNVLGSERVGPQSVAQMTGLPVRLVGGMPHHVPAGLMPPRMPQHVLAQGLQISAFPPAHYYPRPYTTLPAAQYYPGYSYNADPSLRAQMQQMEMLHGQATHQELRQDVITMPRNNRRPQAASTFEPLQVTKQKMTPKKGTMKEQIGVNLSYQTPVSASNQAVEIGSSGQVPPNKETDPNNLSKNQAKKSNSSQHRGRQRKGSRLAINFAAAKK